MHAADSLANGSSAIRSKALPGQQRRWGDHIEGDDNTGPGGDDDKVQQGGNGDGNDKVTATRAGTGNPSNPPSTCLTRSHPAYPYPYPYVRVPVPMTAGTGFGGYGRDCDVALLGEGPKSRQSLGRTIKSGENIMNSKKRILSVERMPTPMPRPKTISRDHPVIVMVSTGHCPRTRVNCDTIGDRPVHTHGEGEQENDKRGGDKKCKGIVHQRGLSMREKGVVDGGRERRGSNEARLESEPMSDVGWIVSDGLRGQGQRHQDSPVLRVVSLVRFSHLSPRKKLEVLYLGNPQVPVPRVQVWHGFRIGYPDPYPRDLHSFASVVKELDDNLTCTICDLIPIEDDISI
ncbi:hypothetical protein EDB84DRAFT_1435977 [Lactarius hengduanensis]|nr:hypothetical protein EDB84DRAFT_1435977 [Lactarius hengduanensis]